MADEPVASPVPMAAATPAAPSPAVTPAPAAAPTAEPAAAPPAAAAPEPAAPDTPEPAPAAATPDTPSLLGEAAPPAAETAPPATPEIPPAPEPPAAPPTVYEFKWPEGTEPVPAEELKPFTDLLGEAKVTPEAGQKLLDLYHSKAQELVSTLEKQQDTVWKETRQKWVDEIRSDPQLGGNRFQTTVQVCGQLIEQFGGSPEQKAELRQVFNLTGAGDNPAMVRFIHNLGVALGEGKPVVAPKPVPIQPRKADRRYAGSMNGAA